ncbi:hypothetical protein CEXT_27511 [Caerostris extrusa]|uniref:Uncharacterized protein n=1 Tax=Caerostris extrusa TaxID=172846 RepID=A0AAV4T0Q0_CAEEX|nr:hypothetical protein CEXT_27511 [Caerostris extrusa]
MIMKAREPCFDQKIFSRTQLNPTRIYRIVRSEKWLITLRLAKALRTPPLSLIHPRTTSPPREKRTSGNFRANALIDFVEGQTIISEKVPRRFSFSKATADLISFIE